MAKSIVKSIMWSKKNLKSIVKSIRDQNNISSQLSSKLFGKNNIQFFSQLLWFFGWFWLIMVKVGQLWSNMVNQKYFWLILVFFVVNFTVFLVKFWSIIFQFFSNFGNFFLNFFSKLVCPVNYLFNYYWKLNVKAIIYSVIIWSQISRQLFSQLLLEVV